MTAVAVLSSTALLIAFIPIFLAKPKIRTTSFIILLAVVALILGSLSLQYTRTDDEYITFRVVDNLINGKGLVYNPGEKYEAITNIGWSLILSLLPLVGFSLEFGARWLSLIATVLCLWGVSRLAENLGGKKCAIIAPFLMLFIPFTHYWSTSGLETMAFCAFCAWTLAMATKARRFPIYAVIAGVSAWLRPEAPLIFIAAFLLNLLSVERTDRKFACCTSILIFIIFIGSLFLFRFINYGTVQAPTAVSKIPNDFSNLSGGLSVLMQAITTSPVLLLGLFLSLPLLGSKRLLILFLLSLVGIGYYLWLGQDTMMHERLLAPFVPGLITLLALGLASWQIPYRESLQRYCRRLSLSLVTSFLIFIPYYLALGNARRIDTGLNNAHRQAVKFLAANGSVGDSVAVQDAGIIGYFWDGNVIDLSGIFDPTIISIHHQFGRVSNNSQDLPEEHLANMNRQVADYILDEIKPRFIILVNTVSADGEVFPSKHNHSIGTDSRFLSNYTHLHDYYYSSIYILSLYELTDEKLA
jgi:hypothetical protein